jgi:hypothetical protein
MATGNSINANSTGLVRYNGAGTFDAVTTTNNSILVGATSNGITSLATSVNSILSTNASGVPSLGTSLANDYTFTTSTAGITRKITVSNSDNTNPSSIAAVDITVGGDSAGSPYVRQTIGTARSFCQGPDNTTANDPWRLRTGANATVTPQSGGGDVTLIQVQPTGETTFPLTPCATVDLAVGTTNVTGDGTLINPVIFDTELFDQNGNYNPATGVFTCPSAGKYLITAAVTFNNLGAGHTSGEIRIVANGLTFKQIFNPGACRDGSNQYTASISRMCSCVAASTITILVSVSGSTKTVGLQGNSFASFTGASIELIC